MRRTNAIIPRAVAVAACFLTFAVGCEDDAATVALSKHLSANVGEHRVIDRTNRGAKVWFVVEHQKQAFKVAVAGVPPHQIVEDRFPDLLVRRAIEADLSPDLHPVVHVQLSKAAREKVTSATEAEKTRDVEDAAIYFAVVGDYPSPLDAQADAAIRKIGKRLNGTIAWEINYYDRSGETDDLRYQPVVPIGFMQQTAQHYPQSPTINFRRFGTVNGDDFVVKDVRNFVEERKANERAQRELEKKM